MCPQPDEWCPSRQRSGVPPGRPRARSGFYQSGWRAVARGLRPRGMAWRLGKPSLPCGPTRMFKPVPILMYHSISAGGARLFHDCTLPTEKLTEQLAYLVSAGYTPLSISELRSRIDSRTAALPERPIALTFDDGYADFFSQALPALESYAVPATLYVTTRAIGFTSTWMAFEGEAYRPMLNFRQLAAIDRAGLVEIGSHSRTHPQLDTLAPGDLAHEIKGSRRDLADALGHPIASFCYPFGYYDHASRRTVIEAGYTSACATRFMISSTRDDAFALARIMVPHDMKLNEFVDAINGVGLRQAPARPLPTTELRWALRRATVRWARRLNVQHAQLEYRLRLIG